MKSRRRVSDRYGGWGSRLKACSEVAGGKRSAATKPPDPERVVYPLGCGRRGASATPSGSNRTGVGVTVGAIAWSERIPQLRDLPTATVGEPFRLYQGTALKLPKVSQTRRSLSRCSLFTLLEDALHCGDELIGIDVAGSNHAMVIYQIRGG